MSSNVLVAVTSRDGRLPWEVHQRVVAACSYAADQDIDAQFLMHANHYGVHLGRNEVVYGFLAGEWSHLLFVDDDVLIPRDTIPRLLACEASVAGGVYPYRRMTEDGVKVVLSAKVDGEWIDEHFNDSTEAECVGAGCMLIHRESLHSVGFPWFRWPQGLDEDGVLRQVSDDLDFCTRVIARGGVVLAHGDVRCGHLKEVNLVEMLPEVVPC